MLSMAMEASSPLGDPGILYGKPLKNRTLSVSREVALWERTGKITVPRPRAAMWPWPVTNTAQPKSGWGVQPTLQIRLVVWNMAGLCFPSYWECHHPNWRSPSFFRGVGRYTTNQKCCYVIREYHREYCGNGHRYTFRIDHLCGWKIPYNG